MIPRRRWFVGLSLDKALLPATYHLQPGWQERAASGNLRPCWTFRGAQRKARRWNGLRSAVRQPGVFEVYGPLGKGDD